MIAVDTGIITRRSEVVTVPLTVLDGHVIAPKAGTRYPLPVLRNSQFGCMQVQALSAGDRAGAPALTDLNSLFLCLKDPDDSFILEDVPLSRLSFRVPLGTKSVWRPLYIRPRLIDGRKSYLYASQALAFDAVVLQFVFAP